jgi:hypothetical protein
MERYIFAAASFGKFSKIYSFATISYFNVLEWYFKSKKLFSAATNP